MQFEGGSCLPPAYHGRHRRPAHRAVFNSGAWRNPGDGPDPGWRPSWWRGCGSTCTPCELDYAARLLACRTPAEREEEEQAELEAGCMRLFWPAAATWFA